MTISSSTEFQKILEKHPFLNLENRPKIPFQISIGVERIQLSWIQIYLEGEGQNVDCFTVRRHVKVSAVSLLGQLV